MLNQVSFKVSPYVWKRRNTEVDTAVQFLSNGTSKIGNT